MALDAVRSPNNSLRADAFRAVVKLAVTPSGDTFIDTPGIYTWNAHVAGRIASPTDFVTVGLGGCGPEGC